MVTKVVDKPKFEDSIWASDGLMESPSRQKIALGHVVERPPFETVNFIENRQDKGLVYLFQQGISEWESGLTYPKDAYVKRLGNVYRSLYENVKTPPEVSPTQWQLAFFSYIEGSEVKNDMEKAKTEDGFLSLYVRKSAPEMVGRCFGQGFVAKQGLPENEGSNLGYSFSDKGKDGFYHSGNAPVAVRNGKVIGEFSEPDNVDESTKKYVTMEMLQRALNARQDYAIGDIYITTASIHPFTRFGYGSWEKFGQGRTLVGHSDDGTMPNWTRSPLSEVGEYTHVLSREELPNVQIELEGTSSHEWIGMRNGRAMDNIPNKYGTDTSKYFTKPLGDGVAHQNVQPSIVTYFWRRVS